MLPMTIDKEKMHSDDRILVLTPLPDYKGTSLVDTSQQLHAIQGPFNNLWSLKYERGILPPPLRQKFTDFGSLHKFCDGYFKRRGLEIKEVIDVHTEDSF